MQPVSTSSGVEGHLSGGPRCFRAYLTHAGTRSVLLLSTAVLAACGASSTGGAGSPRNETFSRPLEIYRDLGFMTGTGQFPVVASFATVAGPADSSFVLMAMSVPNSALRFQRDETGFFAEYSVNVAFMDEDSTVVQRLNAREVVRVATFAETGRTDESVVYQQGTAVAPGRYIVRVEAADVNSSRGFRMIDTLTVPDYAAAPAVASPLLVYDAAGRSARDSLPALIFNPRRTVPYGGAAPKLYLEAYNSAEQPLFLTVTNDAGDTVWSARATLQGGNDALRFGIVGVPAEVLPLGRFSVEVGGADVAAMRTPLVMTISDQWMVGNFDDVLEFLRFIAHNEEIDSLRVGSAAEQRAAWDRFWARRDPLPVTEVNEYRDQFFQRVRYVTEAFREPGGRAGWATDRGEVYIVLGAPDHALERFVGANDMTSQPNAEEWVYVNVPGGRITLLFHDRTGFGRFELVPSSAATFRSIADRLKSGTRRQ
jgi:GWxTD domain-containing protein